MDNFPLFHFYFIFRRMSGGVAFFVAYQEVMTSNFKQPKSSVLREFREICLKQRSRMFFTSEKYQQIKVNPTYS